MSRRWDLETHFLRVIVNQGAPFPKGIELMDDDGLVRKSADEDRLNREKYQDKIRVVQWKEDLRSLKNAFLVYAEYDDDG
jgi:hypothetical protein